MSPPRRNGSQSQTLQAPPPQFILPPAQLQAPFQIQQQPIVPLQPPQPQRDGQAQLQQQHIVPLQPPQPQRDGQAQFQQQPIVPLQPPQPQGDGQDQLQQQFFPLVQLQQNQMQVQILQQLQRPPEQGPRLPQLFNNETQTILDYYVERDREYIQAAGLPVPPLPRHIMLPKPRLLLDVHQFLENRDDETMKLLCNFNCVQFQAIYGALKSTLRKKSRIDARVDGRDKIFLTLNWCKYAPTFRDLAARFGLHPTYTHDVILNTIKICAPVLENGLITWVHVTERINSGMVTPDYPTLLGAVDATVQQVERPKDNQELFYSGKHKMHCVKIQATVTPYGKLMHRSHAVPGHVHDFKLFKDQLPLLQKFNEERVLVFGLHQTDPVLLADSGYQGITQYVNYAITPYKRHRNGELTDNEKNFNRQVSRNRIVVENFFARLKLKWRILSDRYPLDISNGLDTYDAIWGFCAALVNFDLYSNPIRRGVENFVRHDPPSDDPDYEEVRDLGSESDDE